MNRHLQKTYHAQNSFFLLSKFYFHKASKNTNLINIQTFLMKVRVFNLPNIGCTY